MLMSENPLESLYDTVVFHSRDWSMHKRDAWIWGIVIGWDKESLEELKIEFRWPNETIERLKRLHKKYKKLKGVK